MRKVIYINISIFQLKLFKLLSIVQFFYTIFYRSIFIPKIVTQMFIYPSIQQRVAYICVYMCIYIKDKIYVFPTIFNLFFCVFEEIIFIQFFSQLILMIFIQKIKAYQKGAISQFLVMDKCNIKLNTFQNYGQFLNTSTNLCIQSNLKVDDNNQFTNTICSPPDMDSIIKTKFTKYQYPIDLTSINTFCPLCGQIVKENQFFSLYDSETYNRKFSAHDSCLNQSSSRLINDYFDHVEQMSLSLPGFKTKGAMFSIGERQFCVQLIVSHPLSDYNFFKIISKKYLNGNTIHWDLRQEEESFCYLPNLVCFPFLDFKITLNIFEICAQEGKKTITNYVNLAKAKLFQSKQWIAKSQNIQLQIRVITTEKQKNQLISEMNYKYQYSQEINIPIIQLISIQIFVPEEEYDQKIDQNSNSTIIQLLSQKISDTSFNSPDYLQSSRQRNYPYYQQIKQNEDNTIIQPKICISQSPQRTSQKNCVNIQTQLFDFEMLISTGKLSSYVKNSTQSRIFQNFLDQASIEQTESIIKALYQQIPQLVIDQYANYMTQKLFKICSPPQRLCILRKLYPQIPGLVRNKQGTHTIQAFISLLTFNQQFQMVCESIREQFSQLCYHSISTHFIQKIIKIFPLQRTIQFYYVANINFLKFATDKNAMCVLKCMLRRLNELQNNAMITQVKKHIINSITLNTDRIIQDCYGNYVVQFCYQLFGQVKSSGITQMIIQKFVQFSLQKYSSSVVSKCINVYWSDHNYAIRLKDTLKNQGILQMYRNRQGNKILLQLMDKNENTPLRLKIYNLLANGRQPSKYNHERWGMQIGIRSGPVGADFKNFTDADTQCKQQISNNKKKQKKK